MSETETQTHETDDATVVNPDGTPDERTSPPSNPDTDPQRIEIEEEDTDRTIAT